MGSTTDFSFPALGGPQTAAMPGFGSPQQQQQQQQLQHAQQPQPPPQFLQPVKPQPAAPQPLTARSTVVHASCTTGAPGQPQQQQQQQQQAPVPIQVAAEGRRNKVPLEKGFSQVSWLKLSRSGADLTGGAGGRRDITMEEVAQHNTAEDAWIVLHGKVYNITPYLRYHPGGPGILAKAAGKDATSLFNKYHPWVNAAALLERCLLGLLATDGGQQQQQQKGSSLKSRLMQMLTP